MPRIVSSIFAGDTPLISTAETGHPVVMDPGVAYQKNVVCYMIIVLIVLIIIYYSNNHSINIIDH